MRTHMGLMGLFILMAMPAAAVCLKDVEINKLARAGDFVKQRMMPKSPVAERYAAIAKRVEALEENRGSCAEWAEARQEMEQLKAGLEAVTLDDLPCHRGPAKDCNQSCEIKRAQLLLEVFDKGVGWGNEVRDKVEENGKRLSMYRNTKPKAEHCGYIRDFNQKLIAAIDEAIPLEVRDCDREEESEELALAWARLRAEKGKPAVKPWEKRYEEEVAPLEQAGFYAQACGAIRAFSGEMKAQGGITLSQEQPERDL